MSVTSSLRLLAILAAFACLFVPSVGYAQLSSATVTGLVKDASGADIPNVKVVLKNVDTAVERIATTNSAGNYVFLSLTPGNYTLTASSPGLQTAQISKFTLAVNQTLTLDITMEVGAVQQTVTVEAAGELVQSATAELGAVVASKQVVDLPLNGRNFTQLLSLTPGVAPVSVSQNSGGFGNVASGTAFVFPSINGQTNRSNFFMTDGLNNQGAFSSTYAVPPIIDAISEFKVNSHNDQAEFGGALGGIINVATKSGTNEFHGTAWEYLRNDYFNARNTFQPTRTVFRQNQYGVSAGGPVILPKLYNGKNKTFFFGAFEGFQYSQAANAFRTFPTDAEFAGNLAGQAQAYNPFTTRVDPTSDPSKPTFIRDPFPGNQIPASLIDQRLVGFFKSIRPAVAPTGVANTNAIDNTPFIQHQNSFTARIDQNLGSKDFVWFRYSAIYYDTSASGGIPNVVNTLTDNPGQNYGASWVHTFSPTLVLQAQYGRSHQETNSFTAYKTAPNVSGLGFDPNFAGNFIGGATVMPGIGITGYNGIPGSSKSLNPNETNVHQWKANVSKIIGNHTLRFGGELNSSTFESLYNNASSTFAYQQTSINGIGSAGNAMASFLLNVPDSAGRRNVHETTRWGGVMGYYFSDSWKATSRLTLNFGLRYDRTFIPPYGRPDTVGQNGGIEAGSINFNNGTYIVQKLPPSCAERGHAPCIPGDGTLPANVVVSDTGKIYHDTTTNWGPRFGAAYRLTSTMAIRLGIGVFYDNWAAVTQTSQNYEGTWPDIGQQLANNLNVPVTGALLPTVIGQNPFAASGGAFPAPTPFQQVQWYMDPYAKNPYSMQWNLGIAKQLNNSTTVTIDYAGSGSRRLDLGGYYNVALTPGPGNPTERQPYTYIHPTYYDRSWGRGNYHSLQFLLSKRYSGGLSYQVSYTYSKSIDIGSSGWYGVEGQAVQDPYHFNNDRSVSGFDLTHVLSVNTVYELPFGRRGRFQTSSKALNYIIGGWQVNAIGTARSGLPYNFAVSGDGANTGNTGYLRPDLVGDPNLSNPTRQAWFNKAAFAVPAQYTFGNLGRYVLRNSAYWNVDMSLFREFPFMETRAIEFRLESFNLPNTVIMGTPAANISNPATFGTVTGTQNAPRSLQLGLKLRF